MMLIDLSMPDMGGAELIRRLAGKAYTGAVVLVSGADKESLIVAESKARHRKDRIIGYLTKPVTPEALTGMLQNLG